MKRVASLLLLAILFQAAAVSTQAQHSLKEQNDESKVGEEVRRKTRFEISYPASANAGPITGRVFLVLTRDNKTEPRLQDGPPFFGVDVREMMPGQSAMIDDATLGYPVGSLKRIAPGDYYVQAILNVY